MTNIQRLVGWLFPGPADASKPISCTDTPGIYSESQACYSRMRAALIAWRLETEGASYTRPPSGSSVLPVLSSGQFPDTIDDFLMSLGREA